MNRSTVFSQTPNSVGQNLRALMDVTDINNITYAANGILAREGIEDVEKRERYIEYFYDKMLLDTIEIKASENVFLKYCETREVPQGHEKYFLRRYAPLTEHLVPLSEGVPPKSDAFATESFEGTFAQYGRYTELTDRVDFAVIDPLLAIRSSQYGEVVVRTAERLARREAIEFGSENFAGGADNIGGLFIGDNIGIADYRAAALKLKRILVEPLNGKYRVICSPEHIYDLVEDPLVVAYMTYTNTAEPLTTGKPVELFNITFEETMLDEYTYGYFGDSIDAMEHPGEFFEDDKYKLRVFAIHEVDGVFEAEYYVNLSEDTLGTESNQPIRLKQDARLNDGSYIPDKVFWYVKDGIDALEIGDKVQKVTYDKDGNRVVEELELDANSLALVKGLSWSELPVHKSFMFGKEWMAKTGMNGRMGAKFYVKQKGSSGVIDPIDQRQSVGFKIDTLGFNILRSEAIQVFYFVPSKAVTMQEYMIEQRPVYNNTHGHEQATPV